MSLLGTQVYANPDTPCWLSTNGGEVDGLITANGGVLSQSNAVGFTFKNGVAFNTQAGFIIEDASGNQQLRLANVANQSYLQTNNPLYFSKVGTGNANSVFFTSAFSPTAPSDLLSIGGTVAARALGLIATGTAPAVGTATIPIGATNIVVNTTAVTANSKIFITHAGAPSAGPGAGAAQGGLTVSSATIVAGTSFRIDLVDPATGVSVAASLAAVPVNWMIVN